MNLIKHSAKVQFFFQTKQIPDKQKYHNQKKRADQTARFFVDESSAVIITPCKHTLIIIN